MMIKRRVVVTGRGVISPLGTAIDRHRKKLFTGQSVIARSERLASYGFSLCSAGEIQDEELKKAAADIPQKQKKLMSRAGILAAIAAASAAREAEIDKGTLEPTRMGVFLATWFTCYDLASFLRYLDGTESEEHPRAMDAERANRKCLETMNPVDYSVKVLPNLAAAHLAILHQAQGSSRLIADGWRGGLLAVAQGAQAIRDGELDVVLAGGSESPLEAGIFCDLCSLETLASDRGRENHICRPFDRERRGTVLGEGAGVLVLEERECALRRGATLYGEILGSGCAAQGPEVSRERSVSLSMRRALEESELDPGDLDFVHANGDSTQENDRAESHALRNVFSHAPSVLVTATKSLHGHLLSAAGAVELISSLIMFEEGRVAPIACCFLPDPECDLDLVTGSAREKPGMRSALLNGIGLFGETTSVVIGR
jgi:3-oxoacyl-[acyl-carrier-protein] synthase II